MYPGAVLSCACGVVTSTVAGLISGRERKDHTPFAAAGDILGKAQPTVFVKARQAPSAVRKRRRVTLVPIVQLYTAQDLAPAILSLAAHEVSHRVPRLPFLHPVP